MTETIPAIIKKIFLRVICNVRVRGAIYPSGHGRREDSRRE